MSGKDHKTEAEWLEARQAGIGSSESAAVLGYSRWASPWSIWAHKTGAMPDMPGGDNPMMEWGKRHEQAIAEKFCEVTSRDCHNPGDFWIETNGILLATPDRFQLRDVRNTQDDGVLELKCAWFDSWRQWEKQVPRAYQIQLQQCMYCCGCDYGSFAVLGNGYEFKLFHVERNEEFIDRLVTYLNSWWEAYVVKDVPPPVDANPATLKALAEVYPTVEIERVELVGEEMCTAHKARVAACQAIADFTATKNYATAAIQAAMGSAEIGELPDGSGYSWKNTKRGRTFRRIEKCPTLKR